MTTAPTHPGRSTVILLFSAVCLRLSFGLYIPDRLPYPDERSFDQIAWSVASTGNYGTPAPTAVRTPSYVLFLAGIYRMVGHHYRAVRSAQALLGAGMVFLVMNVSRRLATKPATVWWTGLACTIYPFFIYYDAQLLSDSFLTFWLVASMAVFMMWRGQTLNWGSAVAMGICFSILALTKTLFIPVLVAIVAWETWTSLRARKPAILMRLTTVILCFAIPILIWGIRNQRRFGKFTLDTHGGFTAVSTIIFYRATKDNTLGENVRTDPIYLKGQQLNEIAADSYYFGQVKEFIRRNPRQYIRQSLDNLKNFWRLYPRQDIPFPEGTRLLTVISLATEPFVVIFGLIGLYRSRFAWRLFYPIYLCVGLLSIAHALISGQMRYRLSISPFLILFAVWTVNEHKVVSRLRA